MSTLINGNNINATTRGLVEAWSVTEQINLPPLNQSQVNALGTPAFGTVVYNTTEDMAQIYKQDAAQGNPGWSDVGGGGPAIGEKSIIRTNGTTIAENLTVGPIANGGVQFTNGFSAGPIEISSGYTVTIENNASWMIIGDDDLSYAQFVDITSGHGTFTGQLHYGAVKETVTYYTSNGNITHDYQTSSNIWISKNGGGNFTLSLNNVPADTGQMAHVRVMIRNEGGNGYPTGININGEGHSIYWLNNSTPGMKNGYGEIEFHIVRAVSANGNSWTVFGYERDFGP